MKSTKYILNNNTLWDYQHIQDILSAYAAEGWHLEKITNLYLKFRRGEPKAVRYEIIYSAPHRSTTPSPARRKKTWRPSAPKRAGSLPPPSPRFRSTAPRIPMPLRWRRMRCRNTGISAAI